MQSHEMISDLQSNPKQLEARMGFDLDHCHDGGARGHLTPSLLFGWTGLLGSHLAGEQGHDHCLARLCLVSQTSFIGR